MVRDMASSGDSNILKYVKIVGTHTLLAATCIGPGSVVVASRVGAEYKEAFAWCVPVACCVGFLFQEAAGRLVVHSGIAVGEAFRINFEGNPILCRVLSIACVTGATAWECNNFAGMLAGLLLVISSWWIVNLLNILLGLGVIAVLFSGSVEKVSQYLNVCVLTMLVSFLVADWYVAQSTTDLWGFLGGLWPSLPPGSEVQALSLIGTTSVWVNIVLGAKLTEGRTLTEMRVGIAAAFFIIAICTLCIIFVGTLVEGEYTIDKLGDQLEALVGRAAVWCFSIGMLSAGFTSATGCPLASALVLQTLLPPPASPPPGTSVDSSLQGGVVTLRDYDSMGGGGRAPADGGGAGRELRLTGATAAAPPGRSRPPPSDEAGEAPPSPSAAPPPDQPPIAASTSPTAPGDIRVELSRTDPAAAGGQVADGGRSREDSTAQMPTTGLLEGDPHSSASVQAGHGGGGVWVWLASEEGAKWVKIASPIFAVVSAIVLPTLPVIMVAQVVNGVVLPCVALSLLLAVNDPRVMGEHVQSNLGNCALIPAVAFVVFMPLLNLVKAFTDCADCQESVMSGAVLGAVAITLLFCLRIRALRRAAASDLGKLRSSTGSWIGFRMPLAASSHTDHVRLKDDI